MKTLKHYLRHIALLLVFTLLLPISSPITLVSAAEQSDCYVVEMDENSYLLIEETETKRTAEFYEDGKITQRAIHYFETGEVLYYDLSQNANGRSAWAFGRNQRPTETYHIDDFKVTPETEEAVEVTQVPQARAIQLSPNVTVEQAPGDGDPLVGSKFFTANGDYYARYLYGHVVCSEEKCNSWHFDAGMTISAISLILLAAGIKLPAIIEGVMIVGGAILAAFTVQEWIREYAWSYTFVQASPKAIYAPCIMDFVCKRERKVEFSSTAYDWETIYEQEEWEVELIREEILTSPGDYI